MLFSETLDLPSALVGPRDLAPLMREAWIWASERGLLLGVDNGWTSSFVISVGDGAMEVLVENALSVGFDGRKFCWLIGERRLGVRAGHANWCC